MAQAITCDLCGEETAVLMQTNLGNGDSQAVGQHCLLTFALASAIAFSDEMPADLAAEFHPMLRTLAVALSLDPPLPAEARKGRGKRSAPADSAGEVSRETSPAGASSNGAGMAETILDRDDLAAAIEQFASPDGD